MCILPSKIIAVWIDRFCVHYDCWRRLQPTSSVSPVWISGSLGRFQKSLCLHQILKLYGSTANNTRRSELWHRSKAKSSIKSCFGQNYECVYKVWCQTVALKSWYLYFLPNTPETTFDWDRRWNAAESRDSVHRSHPENSRPVTRPPHNHRITIIYQILNLCTVELTWTCTMQSEA